MRTINIDLSRDETHPQKIFGGYAKEHNETELVVTLPTRIISEDIAYYYFEFQTIYGTHLASPNIPKNELTNNTVKLTLWEQLMPQAGDLIFCVTAVQNDADGAINVKGKTASCILQILNSPNGEDEVLNPASTKEELQTMVDALVSEEVNTEIKKVGIMTFKGVISSSALPTENIKMGDTYYLLDKNAFASAWISSDGSGLTWFKTAEVPGYLNLNKCMTFKGIRFPQQGLPTGSVWYGDTYFIGNEPNDKNGYYATAYVSDTGTVTWFKTSVVMVDDALSTTSANTVQNKIITNELINLTQWQKAADDITIEAEAESQAITLNGNYAELMVKIEYPADTASSAANGQIEYKVTNANGTVTTVASDSLNKGAKYITSTFINAIGIVIMENTSLQYQAQASTSKRTQGVNITTHYLNNLTVSIPTEGWKLKAGTKISVYGKRYYS